MKGREWDYCALVTNDGAMDAAAIGHGRGVRFPSLHMDLTVSRTRSFAISSIDFSTSDFVLRLAIVSLRRITIKWRSCITPSTNDFPYAAGPTFTPDAPRDLKSCQGSLNRARRHIRDLCNLCRRHLNIAAQAIHDDLLKICVLSNCLTVIITDITDRITDIADRITDRRWGTLRITTLLPPPEHNLEEASLFCDRRRRKPRRRTRDEIARDATAPRLDFLQGKSCRSPFSLR